jgi:ubiquinone/menaquinone biosynthesis C-methylase UbiE
MPFYDYYDDLPATEAGRALAQAQARIVLQKLRSADPHARAVLEIGPGHGSFALACAQADLNYTALDINRHLLKRLQASGYTGVHAMAPQFPFADHSYDLAFASHVIEHSPSYRDAIAFAAEMRRVVAPGGLIALVAPDALALGIDFWNCDYSHGFPTTRRRLHQLLRDTGLVIISDEYLWGPLQRQAGTFAGSTVGSQMMGRLARAVPGQVGERLYKLRLTFARAILICARVPE